MEFKEFALTDGLLLSGVFALLYITRKLSTATAANHLDRNSCKNNQQIINFCDRIRSFNSKIDIILNQCCSECSLVKKISKTIFFG